MGPDARQRPVPPESAIPSRRWPDGAHDQAVALQRLLAINDRDWHALKAQRPRRAAEQLAAALVLLLGSDDPAARPMNEARRQAIELVEHSLAWLRAELSDPGCPSHRPVTAAPPAGD
jgi:hypothetical protein